ncbi:MULTISPECIES: hypothetical protein [Leptospira]|uniref:hypothetical protein n=1 Tax=Leptospira TaxID=171 RepID=UPI0002BE0E40|nr:MULTISPECIES: hypothetical protein [Leptospira]EMJ62100.1 hypothetical protein LEP1GSC051_0157 [Leptospira sp. P2653]
MSRKSITLQDIGRIQYQNQFTVLGTESLNDSGRLYYITNIHALGDWTISVKGNNADQKLTNYSRSGTGDFQFFLPLCVSEVSFSGVIEVSGFWVNASLVSH